MARKDGDDPELGELPDEPKSGLLGLEDHVIVCGYGQTGQAVAKDFSEEGLRVLVVDRSPERTGEAATDGHTTLLGDVLDPDVLREAGVDRARGLVLLLPSESDNLFATMTARDLSRDVFIIARHTSAHAHPKFLRAGADRAVNPFETGERRLGSAFVRPAVLDLMRLLAGGGDTDSEVRVREITVEQGSGLVGRSLREADIRAKYETMVIAMRKAGASTKFNPGADYRFEAGDVMVAMGKVAQLKQVDRLARGQE